VTLLGCVGVATSGEVGKVGVEVVVAHEGGPVRVRGQYEDDGGIQLGGFA